MTIEESWEDLKRRSPSLAEACRRQERQERRRRLLWGVGRLAADRDRAMKKIAAAYPDMQCFPLTVTAQTVKKE